MPLETEDDMGSNGDKSKNSEYCCYCFQKGSFVEDLSMEQMIERTAGFLTDYTTMPLEAALEFTRSHIPQLKRWKRKNK